MGRPLGAVLPELPAAFQLCLHRHVRRQRGAPRPPEAFAAHLPEIEQRFVNNLAAFADRVETIKAPSVVALSELGINGRQFDIAYMDGSHRAADVYSDGVLTWPMLVPGGIMIFDDYEWAYMPEPRSNPKLGIDSFLKAFEGQYRNVHRGFQLAVEKLEP